MVARPVKGTSVVCTQNKQANRQEKKLPLHVSSLAARREALVPATDVSCRVAVKLAGSGVREAVKGAGPVFDVAASIDCCVFASAISEVSKGVVSP